jgi:hypothetical protein
MARNYRQGKYAPLNPQKIIGDPNNLVYRSSWEKVVMSRFDVAPFIIKWGSECLYIPYRSPKDKRIHRYFIDFVIVTKKDNKYQVTLIEVKPNSQTKVPRKTERKSDKTYLTEGITYLVNQAKWSAAEEYCKQKGFNFMILTEKEIFNKFK